MGVIIKESSIKVIDARKAQLIVTTVTTIDSQDLTTSHSSSASSPWKAFFSAETKSDAPASP